MHDEAFNIDKNLRFDGYQRGLVSMVYKPFVKKALGRTVRNEIISNKELAEELHKPIIRRFNKRKVKSPFIDNTWRADVADMQLIRKFNKWIRFLLNIIDIYSKYAWVIHLKDKKEITIANVFQKTLKKSNRKPKKIWVDNGIKSYNSSEKSWLEKNDTEMYSTYNEGKYVAPEIFLEL